MPSEEGKMLTNNVKYLDATEVAKLVRKRLKAHFPNQKFSIRTSKYSGGASIRVKWTNGVAKTKVEKVVGYLHGATFDGMQDLKEYHDSLLMDEEGNIQEVHFGNDFIFLDREYTEDVLKKHGKKICKRLGIEYKGLCETRIGNEWLNCIVLKDLESADL